MSFTTNSCTAGGGVHLESHRSQSAVKTNEEEGAVADEEEKEDVTTNQTQIGDLTFFVGFKLACHVMLTCVFAGVVFSFHLC